MAMTDHTTPAAPVIWGDTPVKRIWPADRRSLQRSTDRRSPLRQAQRQALVRLRLIEFVAAEHLPPDLMQELTSAIDGVIDIVRGDHP